MKRFVSVVVLVVAAALLAQRAEAAVQGGGQAPGTQQPSPTYPTPASQKSDPAVEQVIREYEGAFNKGDAKGLAALHTEEAVRIGADGQLVTGRAAIEKHFAAGFDGPVKGAKLTLRPGTTHSVTADVRVIEGTFEVTGVNGGPLRGRFVNTIVRQGGQWRLASVVAVPDTSGTTTQGRGGVR